MCARRIGESEGEFRILITKRRGRIRESINAHGSAPSPYFPFNLLGLLPWKVMIAAPRPLTKGELFDAVRVVTPEDDMPWQNHDDRALFETFESAFENLREYIVFHQPLEGQYLS